MSDARSNTAARDAIFSKIRASLDVKPGDSARAALAQARITARARHLTPARALQEPAALRAHFTEYLTRGFATVVDVPTLDTLPTAIQTYLRAHDKPKRGELLHHRSGGQC